LLVKALAARSDVLREVEVVFISVYGDFPLADQGMETSFRLNSLFVSAPVRKAVQEGRADYVPVFLSEIPELFKSGILRPDVALIHVSPPDVNGFCSLGVSVDITRSAVDSSTKIIAQVNPNMPRTWGDGMVHMSRFSAMVECNDPIHEVLSPKQGEVEKAIGMHIASLIEDGSTLQTGIGAIPDAVLSSLTGHKNLGIHTEMFSDGIIGLIEKGVVDNSRKKNHPGKSVTGFCIGSERLYGFINDHPGFAFLDIDYVNEVSVIQRNPKVVAINSCIEIDLTGQVCSDSIGIHQYSGVGGQMDFLRGAALSEGGKPIVALPSRTSKGEARIVPFLKQGAGVVTTRAHVHYVVTEYGIAYLFGKNFQQRSKELIRIAHPDDRDKLERAHLSRFGKI
ncbi:MAG: acetyl-CoA hydrolase/transferase family protein, partial [Bacteroidota bacterium]